MFFFSPRKCVFFAPPARELAIGATPKIFFAGYAGEKILLVKNWKSKILKIARNQGGVFLEGGVFLGTPVGVRTEPRRAAASRGYGSTSASRGNFTGYGIPWVLCRRSRRKIFEIFLRRAQRAAAKTGKWSILRGKWRVGGGLEGRKFWPGRFRHPAIRTRNPSRGEPRRCAPPVYRLL